MADEATTSEENVEKKDTSNGSNDTESRSSDRSSRSQGSRQNYRGNRQQSRSSYQGNRRRYSRRKVCAFCADKNLTINWKRIDGLRRYVADSGAIQPRRKSGLCARHQRRVAVAIKRARHIALLPYTTEHVRIMGKNY